jgi:hypothetical protein
MRAMQQTGLMNSKRRLMEPYVMNWPPFVPHLSWQFNMPAQWTKQCLVKASQRIDLRKDDKLLVKEFIQELALLKKNFASASPYPGHRHRKEKNSYITVRSFSILEKIDRTFSLKTGTVHHDELGNARKVVAAHSDVLLKWFFDYDPQVTVAGD